MEKKLWEAADELRANSKLRSSEYSVPVLGLVFLKWADFKFSHEREELEQKASERGGRRRETTKTDYQAQGVMYLREQARFSCLMKLPEGADIGTAINEAMRLIEQDNEDLRGVLPMTYNRFENSLLLSLLRTLNSIPMDVEGDVFGKVYEYFLGKFAMAEGQKAGEFFTPTSIVRLIVEILEPFRGRIYDPACGSGGMFVQSARFVKEHKEDSTRISIYGQDKVSQTVRLCKMNLAVHGLAGDIREGNTYYEDVHDSTSRFDFVMANPPFNVDKVDKERIKDDPRFKLGLPTVDNANYLWIQVFSSALNETGRAGFVMANSACDARGSEMEIRKKLVQEQIVDAVLSVGPKMFYTVSLACTLWFLDKTRKGTPRENKVLFVDARNIYREINKRNREFTEAHIQFLADIIRLYRSERLTRQGTTEKTKQIDGNSRFEWNKLFPDNVYHDIPGLCRCAGIDEIREKGWSLNPGRYVGVESESPRARDLAARLESLSEELRNLNGEAHKLAESVMETLSRLMQKM